MSSMFGRLRVARAHGYSDLAEAILSC